MVDDDRLQSGRMMLISPERVFYAGLLGRPRQRVSGGFNIYVSVRGCLTLDDGFHETVGEVAVVPPYVAHDIDSECPSIICLVIEPETVTPAAMAAFAARLDGAGAPAFAQRVRATYGDLLSQTTAEELTTEQFDRLLLSVVLPRRTLDPRIKAAVLLLDDFSGEKTNAANCAAGAGLSQSRFLHLFKDETGVSFRAFRAWKRARHLLHFVNADLNLAHLAQDIGYPDSTHFSHSIRRFYGLKPRAIFSGSRDLKIYRSATQPVLAIPA